MKPIKLYYSESLLRDVVRAFVVRSIIVHFGWTGMLAVVVMIWILIYKTVGHQFDWQFGFTLAALLLVILLFASLWFTHQRSMMSKFRAMRSPQSDLSFDEDQITMTSELGSVTVPWTTVTEVWRFSRFWLLLFSQSQFVTLPLDSLDEEAQSFITSKTDKTRRV